MTNLISVSRRLAVAAAFCTLAGSRVATAQATGATAGAADSRWDAFLGCWRAGEAGGIIQSPSLVCVTPTAVVSAVQITTVRNDSVIARDTIDASGTHRNFSKQGCSGWESAEWSSDAHRVYLHSDLTCANNLQRTGTGLFAIAPSGEWLDVQGMSAGGNEGLRVNHYRETQPSAATLAAIGGNAVSGRELSISSERTAAGAQITVGDIGEVVMKTDTAITQAWIVERHARFNLTAKELVAMSKSGIPGSVTDVMVGLSYPDHFALQGPGMDQMVASASGPGRLSPRDSARIASDYLNDRCSSIDSRWDYPGSFDPCLYSSRSRFGYGYGYGNGYGYPYGFDYGYGYSSYGGYGAGYYGGYYGGGYSVPIVIVKGDQAPQPHGRVVNGRGYSQGTQSGSTGTTSTSSGSGSTSSAPAPTQSSAPAPSSSSSGSSSSGSSGGRTAVPRPPR